MATRKATRGMKATVLELPVQLDVRAAGPLYGSLAGLRGRAVELDAGQVQRLGGQCLQVLLAAFAAWAADGAVLRFGAVSDGFRDGLTLLGVSMDGLTIGDAAQ